MLSLTMSCRHIGGLEAQLYVFLTSELGEGWWATSCPSLLAQYPCNRWLGALQSQWGYLEKRKNSVAVIRIQTADSPVCSVVAVSVVISWLWWLRRIGCMLWLYFMLTEFIQVLACQCANSWSGLGPCSCQTLSIFHRLKDTTSTHCFRESPCLHPHVQGQEKHAFSWSCWIELLTALVQML